MFRVLFRDVWQDAEQSRVDWFAMLCLLPPIVLDLIAIRLQRDPPCLALPPRTDRPTDGRTDGPSDGRTDGRTASWLSSFSFLFLFLLVVVIVVVVVLLLLSVL
jgi:hypothetical protein